jgi:hypothetical protein
MTTTPRPRQRNDLTDLAIDRPLKQFRIHQDHRRGERPDLVGQRRHAVRDFELMLGTDCAPTAIRQLGVASRQKY